MLGILPPSLAGDGAQRVSLLCGQAQGARHLPVEFGLRPVTENLGLGCVAVARTEEVVERT